MTKEFTKDAVGDRMKAYYEERTRTLLPRRTYTIIRVDGKNFHNYTRGCDRPYDLGLMDDMDATALALCRELGGAQFAFVQSDEISVLLTDFSTTQAEAWFDGNVQKLTSLSASIATAHFNLARLRRRAADEDVPRDVAEAFDASAGSIAYFDSRAFTIPDPAEVGNYFVWRQQDATRNSISMTAQAHFAHVRLQGLSSNQMQEMLWQEKSINWNDMPGGFKRGRCAVQERAVENIRYQDKRGGTEQTALNVERRKWIRIVPPVFSRDRNWLNERVPMRED